MAQQTINIGSGFNTKDGDTVRDAFNKVNQNFNEIYALTGGSEIELKELAQDYAVDLFINGDHTGMTFEYDDNNNKLNLTLKYNIDGGSASTVYEAIEVALDGGGA